MDIPLPTLKRLPIYYHIFYNAYRNGQQYVSSSDIADLLGIDNTQVRKDIALTGYVGKPKVGFEAKGFLSHLQEFLRLNRVKKAVVIGAGNLGIAITKYRDFKSYGLEINGLFDIDPNKIGLKVHDIEILPLSSVSAFIQQEDISIGIITAPASSAQEVAELLIQSGVKGIWNFAPVNIKVPDNIVILNQDLLSSFLTLSILMRKEEISVKEAEKTPEGKIPLFLCMGSACHQRGSYQVLSELKALMESYHLETQIELKGAFCLGHCSEGIVVKFKNKLITRISKENVKEKFVTEILPLIDEKEWCHG